MKIFEISSDTIIVTKITSDDQDDKASNIKTYFPTDWQNSKKWKTLWENAWCLPLFQKFITINSVKVEVPAGKQHDIDDLGV